MGRHWTATVTITARDNAGALVTGATVSGTWSRGNTAACTTSESGTCSVAITTKAKREQFTVSGMTHSSLSYDSSGNTDPDGDSNGTMIRIKKP